MEVTTVDYKDSGEQNTSVVWPCEFKIRRKMLEKYVGGAVDYWKKKRREYNHNTAKLYQNAVEDWNNWKLWAERRRQLIKPKQKSFFSNVLMAQFFTSLDFEPVFIR